jgi:two-component sensor histidine kinase
MEARLHPRQEERLHALRSYEVLDTDPEAEFDDIVKLAAAICGTRISVINLIDAERQWFKAETGLGVRETPLATSICSHVILEDDFVEIEDTLLDRRMADNPLCTAEPGLRFYAGAPLVTPEGLPLGTLCVLDYQPRRLSLLQRDAIRVLARQVMAQLEMRKALDNAKLLRQEVDHRVKNSLQSISSFLRVQSRHATGEDVVAALATVESRIGAVATLHEQLYLTDSGPRVDLGLYLRNLTARLAALAPAGVVVELEADSVAVGSSQAVAVGSLVNECVSNAFKHAFPGARTGRVLVKIVRRPDGKVGVTCSDNGIGLGNAAAPETGGLGLKIAEVICAELESELEVDDTGQGLRVALAFEARPPT